MEKQINYIYLTKRIRTTKEGIERLFGDLVNDFNSILILKYSTNCCLIRNKKLPKSALFNGGD